MKYLLPTTLLLSSAYLNAADVYVSANAGSDTNTGTITQPLLTIQRAVELAQPGDSIVLRAGDYEGGIRIHRPNITIESYPDEWARIISPTDGVGAPANTIWFDIDSDGSTLRRVEAIGGYYYVVKVESNWAWGEGFPRNNAENITIENCILHDSGRDVIKITPGADGARILNNEIYGSGQRDDRNAEGIDVVNADNIIIRGNYIHDTATTGAYIKGGVINGLIENNLVVNTGISSLDTPNSAFGLALGYGTDYEWHDHEVNPEQFGTIDAVMRNNLIIHSRDAGIGILGSNRAKVLNNTIIDAAHRPLWFPTGIAISELPVYEPSTQEVIPVKNRDLQLQNNIVVMGADPNPREGRPSNFAISIHERSDGFISVEGSLNIDNNLYYRTVGDSSLLFGGAWPPKTLEMWQSHHGIELNSAVSDPQLDANHNLTAGSPAIGAAAVLTEVTVDYDGQPRNDGFPDIGHDEFSVAGNLIVPPADEIIGTGLDGSSLPDPQDPPLPPEDPTPEDPTPEDPTPENPTPEDPTPEDPTPEDPNIGEGWGALEPGIEGISSVFPTPGTEVQAGAVTLGINLTGNSLFEYTSRRKLYLLNSSGAILFEVDPEPNDPQEGNQVLQFTLDAPLTENGVYHAIMDPKFALINIAPWRTSEVTQGIWSFSIIGGDDPASSQWGEPATPVDAIAHLSPAPGSTLQAGAVTLGIRLTGSSLFEYTSGRKLYLMDDAGNVIFDVDPEMLDPQEHSTELNFTPEIPLTINGTYHVVMDPKFAHINTTPWRTGEVSQGTWSFNISGGEDPSTGGSADPVPDGGYLWGEPAIAVDGLTQVSPAPGSTIAAGELTLGIRFTATTMFAYTSNRKIWVMDDQNVVLFEIDLEADNTPEGLAEISIPTGIMLESGRSYKVQSDRIFARLNAAPWGIGAITEGSWEFSVE